MKTLITAIAIMFCVVNGGFAQSENDENVLSYYAVGNSLDGQPIIDKVNVLRFYPVFAFRDAVNTVKVTVYYGPHVYTRQADSMAGKQYWQVLLPKFELGEAIQRLEVEVGFGLDGTYKRAYDSAWAQEQRLQGAISKSIEALRSYTTAFSSARTALEPLDQRFNQSAKLIEGLLAPVPTLSTQIDATIKQLAKFTSMTASTSPTDAESKALLDSVMLQLKELREIHGTVDSVDITMKSMANTFSSKNIAPITDSLNAAIQKYSLLTVTFGDKLADLNSMSVHRTNIIDSVRGVLLKQIGLDLADSNYTGLSVRRSDLIVGDSLTSARILYRNYKTTLRELPALDPAERLGIFRARFVPFAVVAGHLYTPFDSNARIVFEVGLAFGNATVSGDDFVVPTFAPQRLGIAFVITNQLFADSADIRALALTYDFNSYGSVGVGANFAHRNVRPYFSFGINKKAFEDVVGQLGRLFQ